MGVKDRKKSTKFPERQKIAMLTKVEASSRNSCHKYKISDFVTLKK